MTTNNAIDSPLAGTTGTGNFVGSTSPTLVTPTLGVATATSLTFNPTTNGIVGTTTANSASAGIVGEYFISQVSSGTPVSVTRNVATDITSLSLAAGDWDLYGNVTLIGVNATTVGIAGWTSLTSATPPDASQYSSVHLGVALNAGCGCTVPMGRVNLGSTTTVYLSALFYDSAANGTICGILQARRRR